MEKSGKSVSNECISKLALRSQPPVSAVVVDMLDFVQNWGGWASEYYVNDLVRVCKAMNLSPSVRVSGRFFKALAALTFGAGMPSYAVTAVLKRIAASEKIIDGIASPIGATQITAFGGRRSVSEG